MTAQELLELIERHMAAKGLKAAEVSRRAAGHPYLIYKLRKGVTPSFDTMARLCESLGLQLSVGLTTDEDRPAGGSLAAPAPMTISQGVPGLARHSVPVDGGESPDAIGRTWDEVYEDVKDLQERLEWTLAGITDPRAVRMAGRPGQGGCDPEAQSHGGQRHAELGRDCRGIPVLRRGVVEEACDRAGALPRGSGGGDVNGANADRRLLDLGGPQKERVPRRCGLCRAHQRRGRCQTGCPAHG